MNIGHTHTYICILDCGPTAPMPPTIQSVQNTQKSPSHDFLSMFTESLHETGETPYRTGNSGKMSSSSYHFHFASHEVVALHPELHQTASCICRHLSCNSQHLSCNCWHLACVFQLRQGTLFSLDVLLSCRLQDDHLS